MVWTFSGVSLGFALLVGFVLSSAFIRPVRRIENVVAGVARGDFTRRANVPNRDELGTLSRNINRMTQRLGNLYHDMQVELAERKGAEDELRRRAVELVAVNSDLESITYSLSHDLAAPLQSIDGSGKALLKDHADTLGAKGRDHVQSVRSASERMGQLVDDMVNMSRVLTLGAPEPGEISRETVDLSAMAYTLTDQFRERDPRRQVEFVIAEGLTADGDPSRLRVALENLLDNAWKFTRTRLQARIELGMMARESETVYFVRDDGVGFDMGEAEKLFDPFQRLQTAAEFEGVGIGLSTARRIIQSHDGRIWGEGAVEHGATFYFTLP